MTRRSFLEKLVYSLSGLCIPYSTLANVIREKERILHLYSINTGESIKAVYWMDGQYLDSSLKDIFHLLRDHRSGEVHPIDIRLLDALYLTKIIVERKEAIHVISGYRSPKTNEMLRATRKGIAKDSFHTKGRAVDIAIPGLPLKSLRDIALSLRVGGVGYYPNRFVHIDTGPYRQW